MLLFRPSAAQRRVTRSDARGIMCSPHRRHSSGSQGPEQWEPRGLARIMRDYDNILRNKEFMFTVRLRAFPLPEGNALMDRELWRQLSHALCDVARAFPKTRRQRYDVRHIVRVYLWAVLHDRPVVWATDPCNWPRRTRSVSLPDQSTMSRRLRHPAVWDFLTALARRVGGRPRGGLLKAIDGKALVVPKHSTDAEATRGRGVGGPAKGYKLHAIWNFGAMPLAWSVQPLNVSELTEARTLIAQLTDEGYLLADANYDSNALHERVAAQGHQLIAPRRCPWRGLGHRRHSPHRLRSIHLLETAASPFGRCLYQRRREIEREFAGLGSFGGGLQCLPTWVRSLHRVRLFVHAKLIINATRIRRCAA